MGATEKVKTHQVGQEYTQAGLGALNKAMDFGMGGLQNTINQIGSAQSLGNVVAAQNPQAYWNAFMSQAPQLQGLIQGAQSPLEQGLRERASRLSQEAINNVASNLSGLGSLYSGATLEQASKAASQAFGDVASQLGSQQIGLFGNLAGQALGQAGSAYQDLFRNQLQAASGDIGNLFNLAGLYGGIYGQGLQGITQYGTPTYYQERQQTPWGQFMQYVVGPAVGAGASAAGAALAKKI